MKYNFDNLHWQEFETLAFRVMQQLIAPGIQYLEGGSDGGRDMVYTGISKFNPNYTGDWIFQVKHKSKNLDSKKLTEALVYSLKTELTKVFIKKALKFNVYILVTNKEITADIFEQLNSAFTTFKENHKISCSHFAAIGYRHFESCIANNDRLKWDYPNTISHPDFKQLIQAAMLKHLENRQKGWLKTIERQKERFVYTSFFQSASDKLEDWPAVILSGPPKSGKTFNAEILALNYFLYRGFEPVIIETIEDIENAINPEKLQIFIFDDAFRKYSLTYESREWFDRLTYLFSLADKEHLFIFTSREYIFREWLNLGNENIQELMNKILVESHSYNHVEKLAMLERYTRLSTLPESDKEDITARQKSIVAHRNFSPETIRAFFASHFGVKSGNAVNALIAHLEQPDTYLGQVFRSLAPQKQAAVIALLCSVQNRMDIVKKSFGVVCKDLAINTILNVKVEFDELDDSIIRITTNELHEVVRFYHPSMAEFLVRQIVDRDAVILKEVIFKNVNSDLLSLSQLAFDGPKITLIGNRDLHIEQTDLQALQVGLERLVRNHDCTLSQMAEAIAWFSLTQHTLDVKLNSPECFVKAQNLLSTLVQSIFAPAFFQAHRTDSCRAWGTILRMVSKSTKLLQIERTSLDLSSLEKLLQDKSGEDFYWLLVVRSLDFLTETTIRTIVGKDWLNQFYSTLRSNIDELGREVFGKDYPDFQEYEHKTKVLKQPAEKMIAKPNRSWYPRFLEVEEKINVLKEVRSHSISNTILERTIMRYDNLKGLKDYAQNRHRFIVNKGWWTA